MDKPLEKPQVFISHKHADGTIATEVADFITARSNGKIRVHVSSDWKHDGPRFGAGLNEALKLALWDSDVLILVYTSADEDWSFCMWECGSLSHPRNPDKRVIVFQCGPDVPTPFASNTHVDVRKFNDVAGFTKEFLTASDFLPSLGGAVADPAYPQKAIEEAARDLFDKMGRVLPKSSQDEEWPAWPFVRLEIPSKQLERLEGAAANERLSLAREIVTQHASVVETDARTSKMFGLASPPQGQMFKDLLDKWRDAYSAPEPAWFGSCCEQIMVSARRGFPLIRWTPLREVGGGTEFTPILSRVKSLPFAGSVQFDIFFYNLADPEAVPVASRMVPTSRSYYMILDRTKPEGINLTELAGRLRDFKYDRVAILDADMRPLYVAHLNTIYRFFTEEIFSGGGPAANADRLTLADMLMRKEMEEALAEFIVVKESSTIAEARDSLSERRSCKDVFVTAGGTRQEPALGWLTDLDMRSPYDRRWSG